MPTAAKTACSRCGRAGCTCSQVSSRAYEAMRRQNAAHRKVYKTARWQRLRAWFLREHPLCQINVKCSSDIPAPATDVDHVIPIVELLQTGGDPYDDSNLQSGCKACHSWKTANEYRFGAAQPPDGKAKGMGR